MHIELKLVKLLAISAITGSDAFIVDVKNIGEKCAIKCRVSTCKKKKKHKNIYSLCGTEEICSKSIWVYNNKRNL